MSSFRGNIALAASSLTVENGDVDQEPIDVLPCDLPKLLQCLARQESMNGSKVKMEMTFFDYSEEGDESEFDKEQCQQQ